MTIIAQPSADTLKQAAAFLREGRLVAIGTETVYGLGGDASNPAAIAAIYALKSRPSFNPLIIHCPSAQDAFRIGRQTPLAEKLAAIFWPGAMTLILDKHANSNIVTPATAGLESVALRVPSQDDTRQLLALTALPIAAPSANISGKVSPTQASHVADAFQGSAEPAMILDTGPCHQGIESTVIDARGPIPIIARPGGITAEALTKALGVKPRTADDTIISPGQTPTHYAPEATIRLNATAPEKGEAWLGFGEEVAAPPSPCLCYNLSPQGDLSLAAANLFSMLREIDRKRCKRLAVARIPNQGLGVAINDRLRRAAAPREPHEKD